MTRPMPALGVREATDLIDRCCFPDRADTSTGLELELLCAGDEWAESAPDHELLRRTVERAGTLPGASTISWEPGGQLELSGPPHLNARTAVDAMAVDMRYLAPALTASGTHGLLLGMEPVRTPVRVSRASRYRAMEAYFDSDGPAGRRMMTATAAVQVNIGMGQNGQRELRWSTAHGIGPAMAAVFANSPLAGGGPTGWQSTRLANWFLIDPTRTAPLAPGPAAQRWADAVLDAHVMLVRGGDGSCTPMTDPLTFRAWVAEGHDLGWPDHDDLAYHLTTLFPPVRPRGWLEIRYLDASPYWDVASLAVATLLSSDAVAEEARRIAAGTETLWVRAARFATRDPTLGRAAARLLDLAAAAMEDDDADGAARCREHADRFARRQRTPGDDWLDAWLGRGKAKVGS